jgi:ABC-type glycerol-3-phosphate transport system substrate-binding protein
MRKRMVRALIFLVIAVAGAVGAASAAGAFDGTTTVSTSTDDISWE